MSQGCPVRVQVNKITNIDRIHPDGIEMPVNMALYGIESPGQNFILNGDFKNYYPSSQI